MLKRLMLIAFLMVAAVAFSGCLEPPFPVNGNITPAAPEPLPVLTPTEEEYVELIDSRTTNLETYWDNFANLMIEYDALPAYMEQADVYAFKRRLEQPHNDLLALKEDVKRITPPERYAEAHGMLRNALDYLVRGTDLKMDISSRQFGFGDEEIEESVKWMEEADTEYFMFLLTYETSKPEYDDLNAWDDDWGDEDYGWDEDYNYEAGDFFWDEELEDYVWHDFADLDENYFYEHYYYDYDYNYEKGDWYLDENTFEWVWRDYPVGEEED